MKVYLLRHGETEGNVNKQYAGATDTPLTELGKRQAVDAYLRFENETFDVVYSSPLSRALDTARTFTDHEIIIDEQLKEMDFGIFDGLTYAEITEKYPEASKAWSKDENFEFPNGESYESFYNRVIKRYHEIIEAHQVEKLLIVAHSGVIKSILAEEITGGMDGFWKFSVDNCKVSILEYKHHNCYLTAMNI